MRQAGAFFLAVFLAGVLGAAPPAIVSLNPSGPPEPPAPPPPDKLRVTPGKVQLLKVEGVSTPVWWNVVQPTGPDGARRTIAEGVAVPKDGTILAWLEGKPKPAIERNAFETFALLGSNRGGGYVVVQALTVEDGRIRTVAEVPVEVVGGAVPNPEPPQPDPVKPEPSDPQADPELVKAFRASLEKDGPADKAHAKKLAGVYAETAKRLRSETGEVTFGAFYAITFNASVGAGVPRRDKALAATRDVIDSIGKFDPDDVLTGETKVKVLRVWDRIAASLGEAAK